MIKLIAPINVAPYGDPDDYRCCQSSAASVVRGTSISAATDIATRDRHGFSTGDEVILDSITGGAGLVTTTHYYVHVLDGSTFLLCASHADALAGTPVNVSTDATAFTLTRIVSNGHTGITSRRFVFSNTNQFETSSGLTSPLDITVYSGQLSAGTVFSGSVRFGVCCAYDLTIDLSGNMRAVFDGRDWIEVLLNGVRQFYKESSAADGAAWWLANHGIVVTNPHATYPHTDSVTIILDQLVCGDVIEIRGASGTVHATDPESWAPDIGWTATIN